MGDSALSNEEILQQQQQEEYTEEDYRREIMRLRSELAASQQAEKQLGGPSSSQMMPQSLQQQPYEVTAPALRKRLPDISKFDGSRKSYPMWKVEADNKLRIDGAVLGTPQDQAAYLFTRMEAKAQLMVVSFYQNQPGCDARTFVQHLDSVFIDPNAAARALNRLQAMKQGRESFATFLPKFEKELGESQLTMVPDMVKIGYLRGALNLEMQRAMIGPVTYVHYGTFVQALLAVGSQLDCLQYQKGRASSMATTNRVWPVGDEMDWTPTIQVGKLRRRLTPDEQEKCRQEGRCFLCLKRGHRANNCSSKKGDAQEKIKKEDAEKTTKVRAVKKKSNVVASGKRLSRKRVGKLLKLKSWRSHKNLDTDGMYIDILINSILSTRALCDSGCQCFATVSEQFVKKNGLDSSPIEPRPLEQVTIIKEQPMIQRIATFKVDINGIEERIVAYVIPGQIDDVIFGKGWMERHDASIRPAKDEVCIRKPFKMIVKTRPIISEPIREIHAATIRTLQASDEPVQIFTASLVDIQKALQQKVYKDPAQHAPDWLMPVIDAFDRQDAKSLPPHRKGVDHEINLVEGKTNDDIPAMPLYQMSKDQLLVLRKTLTELLDNGFIRVSNSPAAAPVIFVKKPGGGLRFCVDYRRLNEISRKDSYPIPRIDETLRTIATAKYISKVDVISAFHRIRVKEGDEWKTAFNTRFGLYEWLVTPFGLTGAPATFQRYINWVLRDELDVCSSAYIDDVVIYSDTQKEHRDAVLRIIRKLADAGLQLDFDKSEFEASSIKYLGYLVETGKGLRADPEKLEAIRKWEPPKKVKGVRGFLGFCNYYRQFIDGYANIAEPLTRLTRKDQPFNWTSDCQLAFDRLKEALVNAPVLAKWTPGLETAIECDSSGYAVGGTLMQKVDGLWHAVAYFSKKHSSAESNYPIHDKEMLAVVRCIREWRTELAGQHFEVWTDHRNLAYFRKKQHLGERQMRWAYELNDFSFEIVHKPGREQVQSDALSRREQDTPNDMNDDRIMNRHHQLLEGDDNALKVVAKSAWIKDGDADSEKEIAATESMMTPRPICPFADAEMIALWDAGLKTNHRYWKMRKAVMDGERRLPKEWGLPITISECSVDGAHRLRWRGRIWIPAYEPLRTRLIQSIHDSPLAGHPGREGTRDLLAREYTWPGMTQDVRRFVRNCNVCGKSKIWREQKQGLLKPLPIPARIWTELSIDFITGLAPSNTYTNILVVTDRLSKSIIAVPMKEICAIDVAQKLLEQVFQHHGLPTAIVSDRGSQFVSMMWGEVCRLLRITRRLSTAFHPETDGATERANQELETYLRIFTAFEQDDWALQLPIAMMALNNRVTQSTGMSAFFMTHGFHQSLMDFTIPEEQGSSLSPAEKGRKLVEQWSHSADMAKTAMAIAQENQERQSNARRSVAEVFRPGDRVWLKLKNINTTRPIKKLDWIALPYRVLECVGTHAVRLNTPPGIHHVFHVSLVKKAGADPLPSQLAHDNEPGIVLHNPLDPSDATTDNDGEYAVERILRHRRQGRSWQLLVKWLGWPEPTWEPLRHLQDAVALDDYERSLRDAGLVIPWADLLLRS